jgi:hypothetical protein
MAEVTPKRPTDASSAAAPANIVKRNALSRGCAMGWSRYARNGDNRRNATPGSTSATAVRIAGMAVCSEPVVRIARLIGANGKMDCRSGK